MSELDKTGMEAAALVALARKNIPVDVQELLVQGNPMRDVAPGALFAAISNALASSTSAGVTEEQTPRVTEAMVEAAENAVYPCHERGFLVKPLIGAIDMRAALQAALEASRSPVSQKEAVPVAWRTYRGGYIHTSRPEIAAEWGDGAEPLYASPVPAPAGVPMAWCQPMHNGERTPRQFIVRFEDADHGDAVFDDEAEARAFWEQANENWNCYLFGALPLHLSPPPVSAPVGVVDEAVLASTIALAISDGEYLGRWDGLTPTEVVAIREKCQAQRTSEALAALRPVPGEPEGK